MLLSLSSDFGKSLVAVLPDSVVEPALVVPGETGVELQPSFECRDPSRPAPDRFGNRPEADSCCLAACPKPSHAGSRGNVRRHRAGAPEVNASGLGGDCRSSTGVSQRCGTIPTTRNVKVIHAKREDLNGGEGVIRALATTDSPVIPVETILM